jgi:hypothetical protein
MDEEADGLERMMRQHHERKGHADSTEAEADATEAAEADHLEGYWTVSEMPTRSAHRVSQLTPGC